MADNSRGRDGLQGASEISRPGEQEDEEEGSNECEDENQNVDDEAADDEKEFCNEMKKEKIPGCKGGCLYCSLLCVQTISARSLCSRSVSRH